MRNNMNISELHRELSTSGIPLKFYLQVPDPIDLAIEEFPFALGIDGRKYLVLDSEAIKRCGDLTKMGTDSKERFNRQSDGSRQELQEIKDEIEAVVGLSKLTKEQMRSRLLKICGKIEHAIDNLPYAE
jgi:hypothetical protein